MYVSLVSMMILLKTAGMCDYFYEVKRDVILCTHARMYHITVFKEHVSLTIRSLGAPTDIILLYIAVKHT